MIKQKNIIIAVGGTGGHVFPGINLAEHLTNINFKSVWGGTTGFTYNGGPIWGEIENNIYISAGCNGGGIVKGTLFGELLAMSANQIKVPEIKNLFGSASRMPPEPLRKIGFKLISMIESKRAKKEI